MGGGWVATAFERVQRLERRSIRPIPKPSGGVWPEGRRCVRAGRALPQGRAPLHSPRCEQVAHIKNCSPCAGFDVAKCGLILRGAVMRLRGKGCACDRSRSWFGCGDRQAVCRRRRFVDVRGSGWRPRASHGVGHHRVRRLGRGGAGRRGGSCALRGPSDSDGAALRSHRHCRQQRRRRTAQAGTRYQPCRIGSTSCASISPARS